MVALKLVRLIERHSEQLVQGLAEEIRTSERVIFAGSRPQNWSSLSFSIARCITGSWHTTRRNN